MKRKINRKPAPIVNTKRTMRPGNSFNSNPRPQQAPVKQGQKVPGCLRRYDFEPYRGGKLKIAIVGGAEEVGRNMTMLEYGDEIIIIDMGLQFPEESMLGIDYIIPDATYFKTRNINQI